MSQLSEGEQRERKQVGYIIIMWAIVGSVMLDQFVIPRSLLLSNWISFLPFFLTLFIPPITVWYVLKVYWK